MALPPAGWYHDPTARFPHRYWDGRMWTEHVSNGGITGIDPIQADQAILVPAAGTHAPGAPVPPAYVRVTETTVAEDTSGGSIGWVMGVLVVLAALVVAYALFSGGGDDGTPATTDPVATTAVTPETTTAPDETSPPETTTPPETTVPPETTEAPATTAG